MFFGIEPISNGERVRSLKNSKGVCSEVLEKAAPLLEEAGTTIPSTV